MNDMQPVRGMKDLLKEDYALHEHIIKTALETSKLYGFDPISIPIMEFGQVFNRSLGESSDVISKEMYNVLDRDGQTLSLRPEFTAGIVRAFISNGLKHKLPLKFFSTGPVFRYERPQKGRLRQFHQINCEFLGSEHPWEDAEILRLAKHMLENLGIIDQVTLQINTLGCNESRKNYRIQLLEYLADFKEQLSEDSKNRLITNPLRILDSKDEEDRKIIVNAPKLKECLTSYAEDYFRKVLEYLNAYGVEYKINDYLVRGLDYYTHTAFEFVTQNLGSQGTVLAGGRYDNLIEMMGGGKVPAIGFAAGIERLAMMIQPLEYLRRPTYLINMGENNLTYSMKVADILRNQGREVIIENSKVKKAMNKALESNAKYVIFIGDEENTKQGIKIKDLDKSIEVFKPLNGININLEDINDENIT